MPYEIGTVCYQVLSKNIFMEIIAIAECKQ